MNRARYYTLKVMAIPMVVALAGLYVVGVSYAQQSHTMSCGAAQPTGQVQPAQKNAALQAIYARQLPAVQEAVGRAIRHLEAGHQQQALTEMKQVKVSLEALRQALGKQVQPQFLNDRCPIRGAKINPEKVPAELTRAYGQGKVAFCCGGCPDQWDRLTAAEKAAKLQDVTAAPQPMHQGMPHQP